ncbi:trehalose utilization protein [Rhizoctonia solani AG-3 Rhs1AP]|uniref:Trehalose utilization protein n=1 Tax=Rhizoctonia solani AG-3 Rhs1AP TaxID=1086054 RepID=X8IXL8_9AGAM|nr:trehalose utilization protein [Rhizoctonia solani AG-3 Rhs1AP]
MKFTTFVLALGGLVAAQEWPSEYSNPLLAKVLLCSRTDGFRHDSIPTAVKQLQAWGPYYNISFDATEDQTKFTSENLAQYDALMFVHTSGDIFDSTGQAAFVDYISKGGNFAAVHAAATTYLLKPWMPWTETLGATFLNHPKRQTATFVKEMTGHPATNPTPDRWTFDEEVYSFTSDPRKLGAKLLFSVDPTSYKENSDVEAQGTPHPIAWVQEYAAGASPKTGGPGPGIAGRSFYSSLGHNNSTWMDPTFMKHIMGGLVWTLASNTTRVSEGLYGSDQPTVRAGAAWAPVLGSNATAPSPPPRPAPTNTDAYPEATAGANTSSTSGALVSVASNAWAVAVVALTAILGASF